jgi:hypothetical protein
MNPHGSDVKMATADGAGGAVAEAPAAAATGGGAATAETPMRMLTVRVFRGDAKDNRLEEYQVPVTTGMVVLDAIHWIQANKAPDLAVRWNCKAAK